MRRDAFCVFDGAQSSFVPLILLRIADVFAKFDIWKTAKRPSPIA
jgi:hypothetical protein